MIFRKRIAWAGVFLATAGGPVFSAKTPDTKPRVHVVLLGESGDDKARLAAALNAESRSTHPEVRASTYESISATPATRDRGLRIRLAIVEAATANRRYALLVPFGHEDTVKTLLTRDADGALFVASGEDAPGALGQEQLELAGELRVGPRVVFLDATGSGRSLENTEARLRSFLTESGIGGEETPFIDANLQRVLDPAESEPIVELLAALDENVPAPEPDDERDFLMPVEDVFSISGRGTVVTGRIARGVVRAGDEVEIVGLRETRRHMVTAVEMREQSRERAEAGDNVGVLLRGARRTDVERGMVLAKPGSIAPHTRFQAEVYVLSSDEGGRQTPFFNRHRPQFYFRTVDVTGTVSLPDGTEMAMPGEHTRVTVELVAPIAMDRGSRFAIREGGRTIGGGVVTETLPGR